MATGTLRTTVLLCLLLGGQQAHLAAADLDEVLRNMESVGDTLKTMRADIQQKKWTDIIEEYDQGEVGKFLFLKEKGVFLRKDILQPTVNSLVIREGQVTFYEPAIKQAQRYGLGSHGDKAEFLLLGFGSNADQLKETYQIEYLGEEKLEGKSVHHILLSPRSGQVAAFFKKIELWIDGELWVPLQQKLVEPTDDHILIRFSNIQLNAKLSKSDFDLELAKGTKVIGN